MNITQQELKDKLCNTIFETNYNDVSEPDNSFKLFLITFYVPKNTSYNEESDGSLSSSFFEYGWPVFFFISLIIGIYSHIHTSSLLISLAFAFILFFFSAVYPLYKIVNIESLKESISLYNEFKQTNDDFYNSLTYFYNYKGEDLETLIKNLELSEYKNQFKRKSVEIVVDIKRKELNNKRDKDYLKSLLTTERKNKEKIDI